MLWSSQIRMRRTLEDHAHCYVDESTLSEAGLGLFCSEPRKKGDVVCQYTGYLLGVGVQPTAENHDIAYERRDGMTIVPSRRCPGRYINDIIDLQTSLLRGTRVDHSRAYNCTWREEGGTVSIVCILDVAKDEEFLIDYGPEYWQVRLWRAKRQRAKMGQESLRRESLAQWTDSSDGLDHLYWLWQGGRSERVC